MSDIDTIKARVRKLMAVANDGVATDAEIDTAMRLAAKLLDQHHLSESDVPTEQDEQDLTMGQSFATSQSVRFSTWEVALAYAVCDLFGCVQFYTSHAKHPIRVNGIVQMNGDEPKYGRRVCFYGPLVEAKEASELFEEWSRSIATMGVARWGGCFRGDGASYCFGFASALRRKAQEIDDERRTVEAKPFPGSTCTAITLSDRYSILRDRGSEFLKKDQGIHLRSGGTRSGYSGASGAGSDAYREGRAHGSQAGFGRKQQRRQLPC